MSALLVLRQPVAAPIETVFAALTDWDRQGEWVLATRVQGTRADGRGAGGRLEAFTGIGPVGFLDPMEITSWDPPYACRVRHLGRVVRGTGLFGVEPAGPDRSVAVWREDLDLPLGVLGRAGWPLVRPGAAAALRLSLRRFARWVESGRR